MIIRFYRTWRAHRIIPLRRNVPGRQVRPEVKCVIRAYVCRKCTELLVSRFVRTFQDLLRVISRNGGPCFVLCLKPERQQTGETLFSHHSASCAILGSTDRKMSLPCCVRENKSNKPEPYQLALKIGFNVDHAKRLRHRI